MVRVRQQQWQQDQDPGQLGRGSQRRKECRKQIVPASSCDGNLQRKMKRRRHQQGHRHVDAYPARQVDMKHVEGQERRRQHACGRRVRASGQLQHDGHRECANQCRRRAPHPIEGAGIACEQSPEVLRRGDHTGQFQQHEIDAVLKEQYEVKATLADALEVEAAGAELQRPHHLVILVADVEEGQPVPYPPEAQQAGCQ